MEAEANKRGNFKFGPREEPVVPACDRAFSSDKRALPIWEV